MFTARRLALTLAVSSILTVTACSGGSSEDPAPSKKPSPSASSTETKPRTITFGTYGAEKEVAAIKRAVDGFNATSVTRKVKMVTWPDHESALADVLAGNAPDVFMASRVDLGELVDNDALRPVSLLLDERGVDFGDRFSRDAVDAFASERELQCMAYSASPMVIYYNTDMVDFDKMEERGLAVPTSKEKWTIDQFAAAAQFASRRGNKRGVWIEPTLSGLAPFILSGGGDIFDDEDEPLSLAFSEDSTREALTRTLEILRDPALTPTERELEKQTPVKMFKKGKLAMIAGFRDLVPEFREAEGLNFDVIAMPTIDGNSTIGDINGLCMSAETKNAGDAADLIAYLVSDTAMETVTQSGYIVPSNSQVAASEVFKSDDQMPLHSRVFVSGIRYLEVAPFIEDRVALNEAIEPLLRELVLAPGSIDLEALTEQIDEASRPILDPDYVPEPTEEPSEESTEEPTEDSSE